MRLLLLLVVLQAFGGVSLSQDTIIINNQPQPIDIILQLGQSNANANGHFDSISYSQVGYPMYYTEIDFTSVTSNSIADTMILGVNAGLIPWNFSAGSIISNIYAEQSSPNPVAYFHFWEGGRKIAYDGVPHRDWSPLSSGETFDHFKEHWEHFTLSLDSMGYVPNPISVVWIQGENDANNTIWSEQYRDNLEILVDAIDEVLGQDAVGCSTDDINPDWLIWALGADVNKNQVNVDTIRWAQSDYCNFSTEAYYYETTPLDYRDGLHYSNQSVLTGGLDCDSIHQSITHNTYRKKVKPNSNSIQFQDTTTSNVISWDWDFSGSCQPSLPLDSIQNPVVSFLNPGTLDVQLIITMSGSADTINGHYYIFENDSLPQMVNLNFPVNFAENQPLNPFLLWNNNADAHSYNIELASDASMGTIIQTHSSDTNFKTITSALPSNQSIYWRVSAENECGVTSYSNPYTFSTAFQICSLHNTLDTNLVIGSNSIDTVISHIIIPSGMDSIENLSIENLTIEHDSLGELEIFLISPSGTQVLLYDSQCSADTLLSLSLKDGTIPHLNISCPPITTSYHEALNPLSTFIGEDPSGNWSLMVIDHLPGNNGQLINWGLDICHFSTCPNEYSSTNNNILTGNINLNKKFETDGILQSIQTLDIGGNVRYDSKISIELLPDFEVKLGTIFRAYIDGCGGQ